MKGFLSIVLLLVVGGVSQAAPPGFHHTPFRPNFGVVPNGFFQAHRQAQRLNNFHFQNSFAHRNFGLGYGVRNFGVHAPYVAANFGYRTARNFGVGVNYGYNVPVAANFNYVPAPVTFAAPAYNVGGCGQYFPAQAAPVQYQAPPCQQAQVYQAPPVYLQAPVVAFNTGGCGQYFGY